MDWNMTIENDRLKSVQLQLAGLCCHCDGYIISDNIEMLPGSLPQE